MNKKLTFSAAAIALAFASSAQAQWMPSGWSVGLGGTQISPSVSSGTLSAPAAPNTRIDVNSDAQVTGWVRGMFGSHFAVEVPIGAGFRHDIVGAGSIAGVGKIGSLKALPITVLAEYHFLDANASFRPYAAAGMTYAKFSQAKGSATLNSLNPINPAGGTGLSVDSKWGVNVGFGVTLPVTGNFYFDAQYLKTFLKTTSHLSTGQSIDTRLNPDAIRVGFGYRF